MHDVNKIR